MKLESRAMSTSQTGNTHSDIGAKVNKFARWMKNSFRRSSTVFADDDAVGGDEIKFAVSSITHSTHRKPGTIVTLTKSTDGSISSSSSVESNGDMTSPGEVLPSSSDEQL